MREPSMFKLLGELFTGPSRAVTLFACLWMIVFLVVAVVAATNMCQADELKSVVLWATTFLFSVLVMLTLKIWFFLAIHGIALRKYLESSR